MKAQSSRLRRHSIRLKSAFITQPNTVIEVRSPYGRPSRRPNSLPTADFLSVRRPDLRRSRSLAVSLVIDLLSLGFSLSSKASSGGDSKTVGLWLTRHNTEQSKWEHDGRVHLCVPRHYEALRTSSCCCLPQ